MYSKRSVSSRVRVPSAVGSALALIAVAVAVSSCSQASAPPLRPAAAFALPGSGSVSVNWAPPSETSDVASYVATAKPGGRTCTSTKKTSCSIQGLTNGTTYQIRVQSVGPGGSSPAFITSGTPGSPWPPSAVTSAPGDTAANLTWTAPIFSPGGPVTSYTATSYPGGGSCTSTTTSCTATGLKNGTTYAFVVVAHNAFGSSAASTGSPGVTPSTTAGGSVGITYLGPVSASQESTAGTLLQRDAGISVALPNGRSLWIFGDTSSFSAAAGQSSAFIGGSTAAKGKYVPGRSPNALKDIQPAGTPANSTTPAPSQFIPPPTTTVMPDGSGRACSPANGAVYTARWPTGAALLDNQQLLFVTYTDVCVTSATNFTVEGWGFMDFAWRTGKIKTGPYDVFPPSPSGAPLPNDRAYQSPVVSNGKITMFTSECTSLYVACAAGSVATTTVADNPLALAIPASYVGHPAVTDGASQWTPVNISVSAYPSGLRLIEQTSIGGTFVVYSSASPTGPWHAFYSGTLPGCSTTPKGFCYAFVGHPELGTNSSLVISYFKPDSPTNVDIGHVDLALVPLPH